MTDLIDRTALNIALECVTVEYPAIPTVKKIIRIIDKAPTVEPKRGVWTWNAIYSGWKCSVCNKFADNDYLIAELSDDENKPVFGFCPNCGADMRGADNGDESFQKTK